MDDETRFQELREKEINRLIESGGSGDPVKGILTDDEILRYAGNSFTAAEIRLKRGIGDKSDKSRINDGMYGGGVVLLIILMPAATFALITHNIYAIILALLLIIVMVGYYVYMMYIKDYTSPEYKLNTQDKVEDSVQHIEEPKVSTNDELLLLFESKEKIAREMVERRFPAPQITNTKFNSVLDNCKNVVVSQIEILNAITPTEKTKYEILSRKKLIKQVISKIDDLTNELILSEENNLENVIEDMDNLINSVKDYE